jgi:lysyl-tRNA synthetase class 2
MGRSIFMNLQNGQQIYFNAGTTSNFDLARTLNRGDIIRIISHEDFVTRTGEPTWRIFHFEIITRCPHNLPLVLSNDDATFGQVGTEIQRGNRVLNWIINPSSINIVRERSTIVRTLRNYLESNHAIEVETPILQPNYGGGSARPFITNHHVLDRNFYLRISPELYLKRMIIGGLPFVYEISRCFRNEGIDRSHNPEFTLLEFYRVDSNWLWGIDFTERIISQILNIVIPFRRINFVDSLREIGINTDGLNADQLDRIFSERIEPSLVEPTFVCGHPSVMSPLAYSVNGISERFELYINGMEIANGYTEQNDATVQRDMMERIGNVDEDYLQALSYGMPQTCGVGIGIDRLVMIALNQRNISDVISFPS